MTTATIDVIIGTSRVEIERAVFTELLENSVVNARSPYRKALERSEIHYSDLVDLARKAEVPHPLFFAPPALVRAQVKAKLSKLLQGVTPDTFTINTRTTVELRNVELIVKDLLRKQEFARKNDPTLKRNKIIGLLRKPRATVREDAEALIEGIGLDLVALRQARKKDTARDRLIQRLEANQIFVSQSVRGYMPQLLDGIHFSGMTVRDTKVPFIFLAGGDHQDFQEPAGRQIFTLTLMTVLIARGVFAPVTYDASSTAPNPGREYDIVGEMLMPEHEMRELSINHLDDVRATADAFKVTPSAVVVRAMRMQLLHQDLGMAYLDDLRTEFQTRPKPQPRPPKPANAIRKYSGRALTTRMLRAVDEGRVSEGEFCRVVCLNHLRPSGLSDLREALR